MQTLKNLRLVAMLSLTVCGTARASEPANDSVLFGPTHGHSNWSIDAFGIGNQTLGPEVAFEFARGEEVTHLNGNKVKLQQPLDFFMLSDHGEMMGTAPGLVEQGSPVYDTPIGRLVREGKSTCEITDPVGHAVMLTEDDRGDLSDRRAERNQA